MNVKDLVFVVCREYIIPGLIVVAAVSIFVGGTCWGILAEMDRREAAAGQWPKIHHYEESR